ncbi:unnamed protein product [Parajaminaea phylloscopi]
MLAASTAASVSAAEKSLDVELGSWSALAQGYLELARSNTWLSLPQSHGNDGGTTRHLCIEMQDLSWDEDVNGAEEVLALLRARLIPRNPACADGACELVSLGARELAGMRQGRFHPPIGSRLARQVTVVWDGDEDNLQWFPNSPLYHCSRLHVVAENLGPPEAGIPMPIDRLECLRAGTRATKGRLLGLPDTGHAVTHLRYDTRRFAFKPASITATRLRPFLQEPYVASTEEQSALTTTPAFSYAGRPHARPPQGSGNASLGSHRRRQPVPAPQDSSPEAKVLRQWGYGSFQRLHLAWDLATSPAQSARESDCTSTTTGGWPRERTDAWTERASRESARAFNEEMVDSFNELYGWRPVSARQQGGDGEPRADAGNYLFAPLGAGLFGERINHGFDDKSREALLQMGRSIRDELEREGRATSASQQPEIKYAVRAPSTVLKLGGPGAFTFEQRLELFLDRAAGGPGSW